MSTEKCSGDLDHDDVVSELCAVITPLVSCEQCLDGIKQNCAEDRSVTVSHLGRLLLSTEVFCLIYPQSMYLPLAAAFIVMGDISRMNVHSESLHFAPQT